MGDFDEALTMEGVGGTGRNFLDPGGFGGTKQPRDPRVVPGFEGLMEALGPLLQGLMGGAAPFGAGGQFSAENIFNSNLFGAQTGLGLGQAGQIAESGAFGNALEGLNRGISEGFGAGVTGDLLSEFEGLLRPSIEQSKEFAAADIFEGAARSGTTRSSHTVESLARSSSGIEGAGLQGVAQFGSAVAPAAIGAQMSAIAQGLGLPNQAIEGLAGPLAQLVQSGQFQQGLASGAFESILSGIPIQEGRLGGKAQGAVGSNIGGASSAKCWVARAVYGIDDDKWIKVRDYIATGAPEDFRAFYYAYGVDIARDIANRPAALARMRVIMDRVLEESA